MNYPKLAPGMAVDVIDGQMILRDHVLRETTIIYRDELTYNPKLAEYVYNRFISQRERIVRFVRETVSGDYIPGVHPLWELIGREIGGQVLALYGKITGESVYFDWRDSHERSARWVWDNPDASFEEYVLFAESVGEEYVYTREEFVIVRELRELTSGTIDL